MQITHTPWGKIGNEEVIKYKLITDSGIAVEVLNYGCIITGIWTPDVDGKMDNVVLNYDHLEAYITNPGYLGAVIGRHAGRISGAKFNLDGKTFSLAQNEGQNNLHGGMSGLDKKFWKVNILGNGLKLTYLSPDGEEGYPGNIRFEVYYRILEQDTLAITYKAYPDTTTIINLTNHSYFNLSGLKQSAINQELWIASSKYCPVDNNNVPNGDICHVEETAFDFRKSRIIGEKINSEELIATKGYDHPYPLSHAANPDIILRDNISRRQLNITTVEECVVLYSGNYLANPNLVNGSHKCEDYMGVCFETQAIPDAISHEIFNTPVYSEEQPYSSTTLWQFTLWS